ncbi:MAG TPA: U32 family peptidase [Smithellaceae bacterium]|nr:U32 family peptidase [Smithellaceae bacterium]
MHKPELLIPAGNLEKLRTALLYGADAVYIGAAGLSLRGASAEMTIDDIADGVAEAHRRSVRVYAALNTFARDADLQYAAAIVPDLAAAGIDAAIVSDPGMLRLIRGLAPNLELHLSTQANTMNVEAVRFWREQGVQRIILARELSLREVRQLAAAVPEVELEMFVHGAMCVSYSGRCYLSASLNRRSANQGDCSQPCRWEYRLYEKTRPADPLILEEDEKFSYLLSSKDLCLMEHLPEIVATGVAALKIEGRMKSSYYVAVVTRAYRQALDALAQNPENYYCATGWLKELQSVSHRGYTTGFAFCEEKINETSPAVKYIQSHEPAGIVLEYDARQKQVLIEARNHLQADEEVELLLPGEDIVMDTAILSARSGEHIKEVHSGNLFYLPLDKDVPPGALLRKKGIPPL